MDIRDDNICIIRGSPFSRKYSYDFVYFADGGDLARFILSALPNCVVGGIVARGDHLKEIRAVANAVVVMGPLTIYADDFESNEQIIDFVESFRFVKVTKHVLSSKMCNIDATFILLGTERMALGKLQVYR